MGMEDAEAAAVSQARIKLSRPALTSVERTAE